MVLSAIRRLSREEDGQALALAALLMFAIALAVLSVSSLGRTIHDEIRLQNAADATAYTLAARQARAFNFYAYANRAQIAQYVGILQVVSVDAIVLGLVGTMGIAGALLVTAASACEGPKAAACAAIPYVGSILVALSQVAKTTEALLRQAARLLLAFDLLVGTLVVPLLVGANLFLFAAQAAMLAATLGGLREEEVLRIARATAPHARLVAGGAFSFVQNARRFLDAHLREAMTLWGTDDRADARLDDGAVGRRNYARRGMGELVHASRHGGWVYDRRFPAGTHIPSSAPGVTELYALLGHLTGLSLRGHTRLLSASASQVGPERARELYEQMERPGYATARYPTGNAIGANFYPEDGWLPASIARPLGLGRKEFGSVTSTGGPTRGFACTWDVNDPYVRVPLAVVTLHAPKIDCDVHRGKHPWWGIGPFMHFDATRTGCDTGNTEFCQPDVWVVLGAEKHEAVRREAEILRAAGSSAPLSEGTQLAVARALAYDPRPGAWKEPPTVFNPHWRAKLAPVESGVRRLARELGISPSLPVPSVRAEGGAP